MMKLSKILASAAIAISGSSAFAGSWECLALAGTGDSAARIKAEFMDQQFVDVVYKNCYKNGVWTLPAAKRNYETGRIDFSSTLLDDALATSDRELGNASLKDMIKINLTHDMSIGRWELISAVREIEKSPYLRYIVSDEGVQARSRFAREVFNLIQSRSTTTN